MRSLDHFTLFVKWIVLIAGSLISIEATAFSLTSDGIKNNETIPPKFTCEGSNLSPPLTWTDIPTDTRSFVLIMDDPDAPSGRFIHWIVFNIPADMQTLPENFDPEKQHIPQGLNSWKQAQYSGPCPPKGTHHYAFKLFALDDVLDLPSGSKEQDIIEAMRGHVLEKVQLTGLYAKSHQPEQKPF